MYDDYSNDEIALPDFDEINDLQIFDTSFEVDCPFKDLNDMSVSFN